MFLEPIKKDNKLILIYKNPPVKNIVDVRIKSINKLANNTGYVFNIYIAPSNNSEIIKELIAFDKEIMSSIEDTYSSTAYSIRCIPTIIEWCSS